MTAAPALEPWQVQLGDLLMGPGTPYDLAGIIGLDELPELRVDDTDRPGQHGQDSGPDLSSGRTVELTVEVMATDTVTYPAALAALRRASVPVVDTVPLWFRLPDQPVLRLDVKVRRRRIPTDLQYELGLATPELQLRAPGPFAYGADRTASTLLATGAGSGLAYPLAYPLDYGDPGVSGRLTLTNDGTAVARPVYTVWGPFDAAGFEIVDLPTARRLSYPSAIAASSWVVLNTRTGRVLEQGTATRRGKLTRAQWTPVPAGGSTEVQINALGVPQAAARLDVAWADTYWL